MTTQLTTVLVFKTYKIAAHYIEEVDAALEEFKERIVWNVDLDDIDKVLRVETENVSPEEIIHTMRKAGFFCKELED